jgi:hypothetical protein
VPAAEAPHADPTTVAYLVLSHQRPAQVMRLADRLLASDPTGHVVIVHDRSGGPLDAGRRAGDPRLHLRPGTKARSWGGYALVSDVLDAMRWTLGRLDVGWLAVISGQDYPLRPLASFGQELTDSGCDAFLSARRLAGGRPPGSDTAARYANARYHYRWYRLPRWLLGWADGRPIERIVRGAQRRLSAAQPLVFVWSLPRGAGDMIGIRRRRVPFTPEFPCWIGTQWLTLSRTGAAAALAFLDRRPDVVGLYRRSIIADESLLVTVVSNAPGLRVCAPNHHYVRMSGAGQSHAEVLRSHDLAELRACGRPFARKFDERIDAEILDRLDADLLGLER